MSQYPVPPDNSQTAADGGREIHFPQVPDPGAPPPPIDNHDADYDHDDNSYSAHQRFVFHGNASEYFGLWISNLLLTIITIGFYAPWAKVRRLRYFYGNTKLANRAFDFTGIPTRILAGRLIAAAVYFTFAIGGQYSPKLAVAGFILLFLVLPWLLRATFRFNARNSKYSNSRFFFSGSTGQIYVTLLICVLITVFSLGLLLPYALWLYKRYQFDHLHLGQLDFKLSVPVGSFFKAVYVPFLLILAAGAAIGLLGAISGVGTQTLQGGISLLIMLAAAAVYVLFLCIFPLIQARLYKATWNHVSVGRNHFECDINQWRYAWIVISNWIARIVSLGLLSAWAAIRIYRYRIESLSIRLVNHPNQLLTLAQKDPAAFAEELTDILDIDVSL